VTFRLLYVFVLIHHGSRRLVHFNVTAHPTAVWRAMVKFGVWANLIKRRPVRVDEPSFGALALRARYRP